ncbi:hypothetical protein [Agrobacterium fabrum]|uniref:hypothetical protein n=1 Tax=Agrobacterium fabrum TaxID=1176649 RepID=UPI003A84CA0E
MVTISGLDDVATQDILSVSSWDQIASRQVSFDSNDTLNVNGFIRGRGAGAECRKDPDVEIISGRADIGVDGDSIGNGPHPAAVAGDTAAPELRK